jgi:hypothetical protein
MKVPPGAPPPRTDEARAAARKPEDPAKGKGGFAAVLKDKKVAETAPELAEDALDAFARDPGAQGEDKPFPGRWAEPAGTPGAQPQAQGWDPAVRALEKPQGPPEIRHVEAIVQEISVALREDGAAEVHLELNSRTLDGLRIEISGQQGAVAIRFHTASQEVAQLLARNVDNLSSALAARGVNVSEVRVWASGGGRRSGDAPSAGASGGRSRGR